MRIMVWFRSDLRVRDNNALYDACADATDGVVAVYAICPTQWKKHDWGSMKVDFILRNLALLSKSLEKLNIPLVLVKVNRFSGVSKKLLALARKLRCDAVYFNEEYEVNEKRRDAETASLFEQRGLRVRSFVDQVILPSDRIKTKQGGWYRVFSQFKKKWLEIYESVGGVSVLPPPKRQPPSGIAPDPIPERIRGFGRCSAETLWPAGEKHANQRLSAFIGMKLGDYDRSRDFPAVDGTSTLSPYLQIGVLSPRQCLVAAIEVNRGRLAAGKKGVTSWINELIWREFYRHVLIGFPRVSMGRPFKPETDKLPWRYDEPAFRAWCEGRTGVPIVDAGMRQLAQTGWMHNRLRMIVAMFLTKDLFIDWRWGERHFMEHLVDGDLASNNGGWQWSASTGTDAAPYFRIYNPYNQSRRFDPDGEFIRKFVPEVAAVPNEIIHEPFAKEGRLSKNTDYPPPIVNHAQAREQVLGAFKRLRS